uniref:Cathepsin L-like proteinase n=1 Tax=Aceria tosichella TaxID=561515 RepID=A0A6G1SA19_9ACAR
MELSFYYWSSLLALTLSLVVHLLTCQSVPTGQSIPDVFNYRKFLAKHEKIYLNPAEGTNRAKIFFQRTLDIFKANILYADHKKSYFLHQNWFTDITPKDAESIRLGKNTELVPVREAFLSPDTPADQFIVDDGDFHQSEQDLDELITKSSWSDLHLMANSETSQRKRPVVGFRRKKPVVNFFANSRENKNIEPAKLVHELKKKPTLAAVMSQFIDLQPPSAVVHHNRLIKKSNNITHLEVIESPNKDFHMGVVKSQGYRSDTYNQFYANLMMDDFLGVIEAHPGSTFDDYDHEQSFLTGFVGSIKNFAELFAISDETDKYLNKNRPKTEPKTEAKTEPKMEPKKETKDSPAKAPGSPKSVPNKTGIRYHIDWRQTGCIPRVKNQLLCNACYAFTTMDTMEYFYCREKNIKTEFSAQFLVDCGPNVGLNGCVGGKFTDIKTFILDYGIQFDSLYPYTGNQATCPFHASEKDKNSLLTPEILLWSPFTEYAAWKIWIAASPVIVGINMPSDFLSYGGGIHDGRDCIDGMPHALLLVGAGSEDGQPFWLLKNTFSKDWGEEGYFRLSRKAPIKCFLSAIVVRVAFEPPPPESESEPQSSDTNPQPGPSSDSKPQPEPEPGPQPEPKSQSSTGTDVKKSFWDRFRKLETLDSLDRYHHLSA